MILFPHALTGRIKHALKFIPPTFNIHGVVFHRMTITATPGCTPHAPQAQESKEVAHLVGHKPFIYIQVSAVGSAE